MMQMSVTNFCFNLVLMSHIVGEFKWRSVELSGYSLKMIPFATIFTSESPVKRLRVVIQGEDRLKML